MTKTLERRMCSKCKVLKPLTDFNKGRCVDGFHSYCRSCINMSCKKSYHKRKGEGREKFLEYRRLHSNKYRKNHIVRARELAKHITREEG